MNINLLTNSDPTNSVVVNAATGELLFEFTSPFSLGSKTTTMLDPRKQVVAVYKRNLLGQELTYRGQTSKLSDWLAQGGILHSRERTFAAPNERTYKWKWDRGGRDLELSDCQTGQVVAQSHEQPTRLSALLSPGSSRNQSVAILPEGLAILETVVLTFVLCNDDWCMMNMSVYDGGR
ncbi:hypothetical protein OH77DRAFT_1428373 [Trametes cingulata]|nr:hypothetical protein OH77DRAFT_1428373 [Trametes cingulata]